VRVPEQADGSPMGGCYEVSTKPSRCASLLRTCSGVSVPTKAIPPPHCGQRRKRPVGTVFQSGLNPVIVEGCQLKGR
jgi:hypothetical protein